MALRIIEIVLPAGQLDSLKGVFASDTLRGGPWRWTLEADRKLVRILIDAQDSGRIVDAIEHRCRDIEGFHLLLHSVDAAIPRPEVDEKPEQSKPKKEEPPSIARFIFGKQRKGRFREELYAESLDNSSASRVYFATIVLSTVVAAVGLMKNSPAIIVGAMVIAPLLGPVMGVGLAATLADAKLFRRAMTSGALGALLALLLSIPVGMMWPETLNNVEVLSRTSVTHSDIILALAAGAAGCLALTTGVHAGLVGVMVAVALLPPTVVAGAKFGAGEWEQARRASLLLATNVTGIMLAAVITFRLQGVRPGTWWEAQRAKRASMWSLAVLAILLISIATAVAVAEKIDVVAQVP